MTESRLRLRGNPFELLPYLSQLLDQATEEGSGEDPWGRDRRLRRTLRHLLGARSIEVAGGALQRFVSAARVCGRAPANAGSQEAPGGPQIIDPSGHEVRVSRRAWLRQARFKKKESGVSGALFDICLGRAQSRWPPGMPCKDSFLPRV